MTENEKARRVRASLNYRKKRGGNGEAQVAVWLPEDLRVKLDAVVKAGQFKNRSEAAKAAFSQLLEGSTM